MSQRMKVDDPTLARVGYLNRQVPQIATEVFRRKEASFLAKIELIQQELEKVRAKIIAVTEEISRLQDELSRLPEEIVETRTYEENGNTYTEVIRTSINQGQIAQLKNQIEAAERNKRELEELEREFEKLLERTQAGLELLRIKNGFYTATFESLSHSSDSLIQQLRAALSEYEATRILEQAEMVFNRDTQADLHAPMFSPLPSAVEVSPAEPLAEPPREIPDYIFNDGQGRNIGLRTFITNEFYSIRGYDLDQTDLPDVPGFDHIAQADLTLVKGQTDQLLLENLEIFGIYRGAGISLGLVELVENIGERLAVMEIYGPLESYEAAEYARSLRNRGWQVRPGRGYYGVFSRQVG